MTNKEAIEILNDFIDVEGSAVIGMTSLREAIKIAIKAIEERPQGEWLDEQFVAFHLTCNKCGCNIRRQKDIVFEGEYNYNFCPNCGADMRGGRE